VGVEQIQRYGVDPQFGDIVTGVFTPVLTKHSKSFSLIDCISVSVALHDAERSSSMLLATAVAISVAEQTTSPGSTMPTGRASLISSTRDRKLIFDVRVAHVRVRAN